MSDISYVRSPRLMLRVNGDDCSSIILSADINSAGWHQADSFRMECVLNADPKRGLGWWASLKKADIFIELGITLTGGQPATTLFLGRVDDMQPDPPGGTIQLSGRDLTGLLIDKRTANTYQNKRASDIATALALEHGLKPVVTPTTGAVGRFYQIDHSMAATGQFSRAQTQWDLLSQLALDEGKILYVHRRELHFEDPPSGAPSFTIHWDNAARRCNVLGFRMGHSLTLARDVVVSVRAWSSRHRRGIIAYSPAGGLSAVKLGKAVLYPYNRPNIVGEAQAQLEADRIRAQRSQHELTVDFELPGELTLTPRSIVALAGDVADWAGTYFVDSITRRLSRESGYTQRVHAKNHGQTLEDTAA